MPTKDGWRDVVLDAVKDPELLDLLAQFLEEIDNAKQALRDKGYGCIGMPWRKVINEIPDGRY